MERRGHRTFGEWLVMDATPNVIEQAKAAAKAGNYGEAIRHCERADNYEAGAGAPAEGDGRRCIAATVAMLRRQIAAAEAYKRIEDAG